MEPVVCKVCPVEAQKLLSVVRGSIPLTACYNELRTTQSSFRSESVDTTEKTTATIFKAIVDGTSRIHLRLSYTTVIGRHREETVFGNTVSKTYSMKHLIESATDSSKHLLDDDIQFACTWHAHRSDIGLSKSPIFSTTHTSRCDDCTRMAKTILSRTWRDNSEDCVVWTYSDGFTRIGDNKFSVVVSPEDLRRVSRGQALFDSFLKRVVQAKLSLAQTPMPLLKRV